MSKEVRDMFASIAPRYDITNDALSLGMHRAWRNKVLKVGNFRPGEVVLDLCTGTGDLAFCISKAVGTTGCVYGLDFVQGMLVLAERKLLARKNSPQKSPQALSPQAVESARATRGNAQVADQNSPVYFLRGDAMSLPFPSSSVDCVTISFGIRNVDNVVVCLEEIHRVLAPGGRVIVLEFGQPTIPVFAQLYQFYSRFLMPTIGGLLTGNRAAYEYLPRTSRQFPAGEKFLEILSKTHFVSTQATSLLGGIAYIYQGKIQNSPKPKFNPDKVSQFSFRNSEYASAI